MKLILSITVLLLCSVAFAQNTIIGKWKPVYFKLDKLMTGDVKADSTFLSGTLVEAFKDDKDPQASKEAMQFMAEMMLRKMKDMEEEFIAPGEYIETNTKRNISKKGTYSFNADDNSLVTTLVNRTHTYKVSFTSDRMVLTSALESTNGKKGELEVVYERVK